MSKFLTEFYDRVTGSHFVMAWANEEQYLRGKVFLNHLTGGGVGKTANPQWLDFYILETEEQREAMLEFRRRLREGE